MEPCYRKWKHYTLSKCTRSLSWISPWSMVADRLHVVESAFGIDSLARPTGSQGKPLCHTSWACKKEMHWCLFNFILAHNTIIAFFEKLVTSSQHTLVFNRSTKRSQVLNLIRGMHLDFHIQRKGAGGFIAAKWCL